MRRGGNLNSRLDLGIAEEPWAKSPRQGLCCTCPPLVVGENPMGARGAYVPVSSQRHVSALK